MTLTWETRLDFYISPHPNSVPLIPIHCESGRWHVPDFKIKIKFSKNTPCFLIRKWLYFKVFFYGPLQICRGFCWRGKAWKHPTKTFSGDSSSLICLGGVVGCRLGALREQSRDIQGGFKQQGQGNLPYSSQRWHCPCLFLLQGTGIWVWSPCWVVLNLLPEIYFCFFFFVPTTNVPSFGIIPWLSSAF